MQYDNQRLMYGGGVRTASRKARHIQRAAQRREVKAGYPIEGKFETPEQVRAYLNADKIVCLRCGKNFKWLSPHLRRIHGWTSDQYKGFYGLPWRHGLMAPTTRAKRIAHGHKLVADRHGVWAADEPTRKEYRHLAHIADRRPAAPFQRHIMIRNLGDRAKAKK